MLNKILKKKLNQKNIYQNWKIKRECLELIIECAKSQFPKEFGGLLRKSMDIKEKNTISELIILPGTISGDSHAIFRMHMLPIDFSIIGTVHSHPSYSSRPSNADIQLFQKHGKIHIILARPYDDFSWSGYDYNGYEIEIEVL